MKEADVLVIGAGAAGLTSAYAFLSQGLTVTCIEQGVLEKDLIAIEEGGELEKWGRLSCSPEVVGGFSAYSIDSTESDIEPALYHAVGGSTFIFSAQYPRFHQSDFCTKSDEGVGTDWPIGYADILPYYELNEEITGVAGLQGDPMYPDWNGDMMPPVPLGDLGERLAAGFRKLGWHHWPAYAAINTIERSGRPADSFERPTNLGDVTGAKGSADNAYLSKCLQLGMVLHTERKAIRLNEIDGEIESVEYLDKHTGNGLIRANLVVVACGGLGTPRLLLHSISKNYPTGLGNNQDCVGRYLMLHPLGYVEGYFHDNLSSNMYAQGCCLMSQEFYKTRRGTGFKRGYTMQTLRGPLPIEGSINLYRRKLLRFGEEFWQTMDTYYNHSAHVSVICEDLPDATNRLTLDHQKKGSDGQFGLRIHYRISENSKAMLSHGVNAARTLLREAGAYKTYGFGPVRRTGWHILGTCRMGTDIVDSVVNEKGYVHGISNLMIVDGSVFPTSSAVNPASTIQALSLYLSSLASREMFGRI